MALARQTQYRFFPGMSQEWLEAELVKVNAEIAGGKQITAWKAGDLSAEHALAGGGAASAQERKDWITHDLSIVDPDGWPAYAVTPITRTNIVFG